MRLVTLVISTLLLIVVFTGKITAQRITVTIAGNGTAGYGGDGYPNYLTEINEPCDICMDAMHNIYFVDRNFTIRKITAKNGIVTTVAGGGISNLDGVPAILASISPSFLCTDSSGNLYFPTGNKIRKVNATTGIITTIAGADSAGFSGDSGLATGAMLNAPQGICMDVTGNIYFADQGNNRIRKITATTGIITTIADTAIGYSFYPIAICVNSIGDLFFLSGGFIKKINATTGIITAIAGTGGSAASGEGGPAISACLGYARGISIDISGNLYVTELSCSCREINMATGIINRIAGDFSLDGYNGDGFSSMLVWFNQPLGLCVDGIGTVYVADQVNNRIRKSILLTHTPSFAYGRGQTINPCPGSVFSINSQMAITDLDSAQSETWIVITSPLNGTLSGFPYTMASLGAGSLVTPVGLSYLPHAGFSGNDSFKVVVSDGVFSDTVVILVSVPASMPSAGSIIGLPDTMCVWEIVNLTETITGGEWIVTNNNAIVSGSGSLMGNSTMGLTGVDTITYKVISGCTVTTSKAFYVSPFFDPGIITGIDSLNAGFTTTLSDTVSGGSWSSSNNSIATISNTGIVYGVSPGVDTMWYILPTPCGPDSAYFVVKVLPSNLVNNIMAGINNLTIAPNPARERFSITLFSANDELVTITISNILGERLKEISGITNKQIDASLDVPAGVYILNAKIANGNYSSKIIMQ